jgi:tRNA-splicing ligase RtcB
MNGELAPVNSWLAAPLAPAVAESIERLRAADGVRQIALMPDVHLAADICVGTVIATEGVIFPQAVGGDIGCGMAALAFNLEADALDNERAAGRVLAGLYERVPSNRRRPAQPLPDVLSSNELSDARLTRVAQRDGAVQLGTLGRGNHFLELQADTAGQLWAMVHSGSRAVGQAIAHHHYARSTRGRNGPIALESETENGAAYLADCDWARAYAAENRLAMLRAVADLMGELFGGDADWASLIHSDHNHVQREVHEGRELLVHRKGAQSARAAEPGIVPGSMGSASFHTAGKGCAAALLSCSHGAGRRMSRTDARREVRTKDLARQVGRLWYDHRRADRLRDEAPAAYNDIRLVMQAQRELTKTIRELRPVLSYKGT